MTRTLIALLAAGILSACALPEPSANAAGPYVERETITGSRLPPKGNAQGTKRTEMTPLERDEFMRPKATPLGQ
jgi:hypothetical protein